VNLNEPPSLLRNDLRGKQNWVKVKLEGVKSNRSAIGARVLAHDRPEPGRSVERSQGPPRVAGDVGLHERHAEAEEREPGGGEPQLGRVRAAARRSDPLRRGLLRLD